MTGEKDYAVSDNNGHEVELPLSLVSEDEVFIGSPIGVGEVPAIEAYAQDVIDEARSWLRMNRQDASAVVPMNIFRLQIGLQHFRLNISQHLRQSRNIDGGPSSFVMTQLHSPDWSDATEGHIIAFGEEQFLSISRALLGESIWKDIEAWLHE